MSTGKRQIGVTLSEEDYEVVRKLAFDAKKSLAGYTKSLLEREIKKEKKRNKND